MVLICAHGITLLKLTTDGHKASCNLSSTAELLVVFIWFLMFEITKILWVFIISFLSREFF